MRTPAFNRTFNARTKWAVLADCVRGKELIEIIMTELLTFNIFKDCDGYNFKV